MTTNTVQHHIPDLKTEIHALGTPDANVWLEQDFGGTTHQLSLHASQVRFLAEQLELIAPGSADAAATEHRARMFRMLDLIHTKASGLRDSLDEAPGHEVDAQTAAALADFTAFMRDDFAPREPTGATAATTSTTTSEVSA